MLAKCYRLADVDDDDWFYNGFLALDKKSQTVDDVDDDNWFYGGFLTLGRAPPYIILLCTATGSTGWHSKCYPSRVFLIASSRKVPSKKK